MFVGDRNGRLVIANPVIELDHPQLESIQRLRLVLVQAQCSLQGTTLLPVARSRNSMKTIMYIDTS
jgi:hypothetical protein